MNVLGSLSVELTLEIKQEILAILDEILSLKGRAAGFNEKTPLLGAIPELDSMAVVALITTLEERFGFSVDDDEIEPRVPGQFHNGWARDLHEGSKEMRLVAQFHF